MATLKGRVERQRAIVHRLRAQLAFEASILARLEQRSESVRPSASSDLRTVLARAMERRASRNEAPSGDDASGKRNKNKAT